MHPQGSPHSNASTEADPEHIGQPVLFALLALALGCKMGLWLYQWSRYFPLAGAPHRAPERAAKVDVLTTACPGTKRWIISATRRRSARAKIGF